MLKVLAKSDLARRDIAADIIKEYQAAGRYSLKTWWQRAMTSNGISLAHPTAHHGFAIASELDKVETSGSVTKAKVDHTDEIAISKQMEATREQHSVQSAKLDQAQKERKMTESLARRRERPGFFSRLRAVVDEAHAAHLREQREQRVRDINAGFLRDAAERRELHATQQKVLQNLRREQTTDDTPHYPEAPHADMATRQRIINTQILVTLSSHLARPFGTQVIGQLHLSAISQGLDPGHPLAQDIDPNFMTAGGKLQADARVLAFGLTVVQAKHETQQLQMLAESAPYAAQDQARRVQSLLREGFSSEAGKLFNRNLPPIKAAISTAIDDIANRPLPPTAQVIPLRA